MLIKSFCVGNKEKSFFIDKFKKGINIINSDDNDKGKTIVSQGIMYCFGNTPCFPVGFDEYRDYYFIIEFEMNKNNYLGIMFSKLWLLKTVCEYKMCIMCIM